VQTPDPLGENRLLRRLGADDIAWLLPHLKKVAMTRDAVLHRAREPIEQVYFPLSGMISVLAMMRTGEAIETAVVGREGGSVHRWEAMAQSRPVKRCFRYPKASATSLPP
jgi:hypothetical protein